MLNYLATLEWNDILRNKTVTEFFNILRYEIESTVEQFVPLKKQGKRSTKKHLSKEAIRKIAYKQTRNDCSYYKEALNAATTEIRKSKGSYEQKLACNIKIMTVRVCMCEEQIKRTRQVWTTRRQCWKYNITGFFNGGRLKWVLQFLVYHR